MGDRLDSEYDFDLEDILGGDLDVPIDFGTFILSLSSSAAFHLGLAPHPEKGQACRNLPMAKQTIDILSLLQEKTNGNLTGEEERLLGEILYNLRMAYVRESARCKCESKHDSE